MVVLAPQNGTWEQGKVIVFDDSYEHEIWHAGQQRRVALLLHLEVGGV